MGVAPEARMGVAPEARMGVAPEARMGVAPEARMADRSTGPGSCQGRASVRDCHLARLQVCVERERALSKARE